MLIEVLVASMLLITVAVGVLSLSAGSARLTADAQAEIALDVLTRALWGALEEPANWHSIVMRPGNDSFGCLRKGTGCRNAGGAFVVADAQGHVLLDATEPGAGFDLYGTGCDAFADPKDRDCVYRATIEWSAVCRPAPDPCVDPQIRVVLHFTRKDKSSGTPAAARYGFERYLADPVGAADPGALRLANGLKLHPGGAPRGIIEKPYVTVGSSGVRDPATPFTTASSIAIGY